MERSIALWLYGRCENIAKFESNMPVYDVRQKVKRKFMAGKTAWSFGASATTRFITAACRFGSNKTIVAHCVSKSGLSNEWESTAEKVNSELSKVGVNNTSIQIVTAFTIRKIRHLGFLELALLSKMSSNAYSQVF
ncbi:hypothetical protein G5I_08116 [Acromyrmex echinatior]|uniref:Uncharacterized protein n=1 Tax=Acromyrmex echinatior TaxID=103372 RepID=F4WQM6_ACREC|nr:hypothetical protein G5I_08116 [Acromyrmex echinatior]